MSKKQSVLLGLRDKTEKNYANMLDDMLQKFKNKQTLFKGQRRTYQAFDGFADEPGKRGFTKVSSTVTEQLAWFKTYVKDFFDITFSIEKTNSTGITADLVVDGQNWGKFSTLELLRLKSILDGKIKGMIAELPVRAENQIWDLSKDAIYEGLGVYENPIDVGNAKTTLKDTIIVNDPHADKPGRAPVSAEKTTQVDIGKYTSQDFSGELSMLERAQMLVRYDKLYTAVIEALENANNVESTNSELGDKVLQFLF